MFGVLYAAPGSEPATLIDIAREFSPRIEPYGPLEIAIDLSGLTRLFGTAHEIGHELRRTAADRGVRVRVAIAGTCTAARLIVRQRVGVTVIDPGTETDAVAPLSIAFLNALDPAVGRTLSGPPWNANDRNASNDPNHPKGSNDSNDLVVTLRRWGLRTLGEFAALAPDDVAARLGQEGVAWQRVACGQDAQPLVPAVVEEPFEQALDLEWPIDGLEPLSFVLGRLLEPLSARLERRDRGAAVLHIRLRLVKRDGVTRAVHERSLQLPAPMRDARTLRTLALLDLESHPPDAAIDRVVVAIDPTPGRVLQFSLLTRPLPSPEQLSTLMARLSALMGEGRCGSPMDVDSWQPGAFAMKPFAPRECESHAIPVEAMTAATRPVVALRRFRFPVPARVRVEDGRPVRVTTDRPGSSGGRVQTGAGPWRTSGEWWSEAGAAWNRDEWDVALSDGATYRVFRERDADRWFVEGIVD